KGRGMSVVGRIKQSRWKTEEGKNASRVTIIAEKVEFKQRFAKSDTSESDAHAAESESAAQDEIALALAAQTEESDLSEDLAF
ncbi:MAG: single-stranded DNA-binding protein, partial [Treponemataceae bacterium]|nr:single-stranded DNA-binding protein [Treponemataceae bacterium]